MGAYSAQSAFFVTISFIPFIMMMMSILKFLPFAEAKVLEHIVSVFPGGTKELVASFLTESFEKSGVAVISITAVSTLWAASIGVFSVVKGLNRVYGTSETRNVFVVRIMSVFYTLMIMIMLVLCLGIFVFGNTITEMLQKSLPEAFGIAVIILSVRKIVGVVVLSAFFLLLYKIIPNRKTKFALQLPGALLSGCGWVGFSYVFSYYYENIANYSYLYGSLSVMVFFMLWLFVCIYILFIGAELNRCIEERVERIKILKI